MVIQPTLYPQHTIGSSENSVPVITQPDFSKKHEYRTVKIILFLILIIVSAFIIAVAAFYTYIASILVKPHNEPITSNPQSKLGIPYETVTFSSASGQTSVEGWYMPCGCKETTKTVVFSHSYGGNREEIWAPVYPAIAELHKRGYNVLTFDYGYIGPKHKRPFTGGVQEKEELLGGIRYAKEHGASEIWVWGFSMGAGTALQAGLVSNDISGMILDSTFVVTPETMYENVKQQVSIPEFPSVLMLKSVFPIVSGVNFGEIPYDQVTTAAYRMPIFFIHSYQDKLAPYTLIEQISHNQASNPLSEIWLQHNALHEMIYNTAPKQYIDRTMGFLDRVTSAKLNDSNKSVASSVSLQHEVN
jgi:alpha/beta superfamily hydrolase